MKREALCIIPARGGSKRIPRKNIRPFCGRPMLAWAVDHARASGCFGEIMVSTDDPEIAQAARDCGAAVPFLRKAETAGDHATTADALAEVLLGYKEQGGLPALACCLYPTAALLSPGRLREGKDRLESDPELEGAASVLPYPHPVQRALTIRGGFLAWLHPEYALTRTQDLEPTFHDAGQFYWFRTAAFLASRLLLGPRTAPVPLGQREVCDIDTEADWARAERIFSICRPSLHNQEPL